jgi:WD40 repeat protein
MGLYYRPESSLSSSGATVLAFCPSGELLAGSGAAPNHVSLWSTVNGHKKYHIDTCASAVTCLSWSSSKRLHCGLENGYVLSVALDDGSQVKRTIRNLTALLIISRLSAFKAFTPIRLYRVFQHIQAAIIWPQLPVMRCAFGNGQEVSPFDIFISLAVPVFRQFSAQWQLVNQLDSPPTTANTRNLAVTVVSLAWGFESLGDDSYLLVSYRHHGIM